MPGLPLALNNDDDGLAYAPISPQLELGAYEELWLQKGMTFKRMAEKLEADPHAMPSNFVEPNKAMKRFNEVVDTLTKAGRQPIWNSHPSCGRVPGEAKGC